ncbi:MAG: DUF2961 domain-containing protein, partial [Sphingobacteriales bacterium]
MLQTEQLPLYRSQTYVEQASSYDRMGKNNDGFNGTYSFLRKNEDGSLVIFEAPGKGIIERIWTPTPTDDTLDFYFDGAGSPSYSIKFNDLFSGKIFPFLNPLTGKKVGGWYSYLPIPFANGCKVVFRGKKMLFYQVQYRALPANSLVQTFNPELSMTARSALQSLISKWSAAPSVSSHNRDITLKSTASRNIRPGERITIADIKKGGRIVGIELSDASIFESMNNEFDLRISWDGDTSPAVYAPVADFFGYAFGSRSMKSLLTGVDSNKAYCFIPMPFDNAAKIEVVYRKTGGSQKPVNFRSTITFTQRARDKATEGRFYALWKREQPAIGKPYVFLSGQGRGHYIGTLLLSQAKTYDRHTEFFEGDDSTVLDGKHFLHGTGSEDYFNGGWYAQPNGWVERKGAPLHGCLDYSLPLSRTGGYRFYMSDKLPFERSIYHSIEHGPEGNNREVEYSSVAMYYADQAIASGEAPTNATTRIFTPDTLSFYPRLMEHVSYAAEAKLADGNAELDAGRSGSFMLDPREIGPG